MFTDFPSFQVRFLQTSIQLVYESSAGFYSTFQHAMRVGTVEFLHSSSSSSSFSFLLLPHEYDAPRVSSNGGRTAGNGEEVTAMIATA
jgi:hypothetical protein